MYTFNSRIRYSETDETGRLSILGIINYMQDTSTFQSEDRRVGVSYMEANHKAWLLSSWQIIIERRPMLGENVSISTWPTSRKGIYGLRDFQIKDSRGESLVRANSVWFLYDTENNVPLRVQDEDLAPYGEEGEQQKLPPAPRKILIPEEFEEGEAILVTRHHLDTNHHVNNAVYVDMAREAIPSGLEICEIRAEYKKAALLGDRMIPRVTKNEDNAWTVVLTDPAGEVKAVVWLRTN